MKNENKEDVACDKMNEVYKKCRECPHREGHTPIGTCNIKKNPCTRNIEDTYGVETQCLPLNKDK